MARPSRKTAAAPVLSRQRQPAHLDAAAWQRGLRAQFGREQEFAWSKLDDAPLFGRYRVHNPSSARDYQVLIHGQAPGDNQCSCADYATNELGTCKHIEFLLHCLRAKRGAKSALARGWQPLASEIRVQPGALRTLRFHPGAECPPALLEQVAGLFDREGRCLVPERWPELEGFLKEARRLARHSGHTLELQEEALA